MDRSLQFFVSVQKQINSGDDTPNTHINMKSVKHTIEYNINRYNAKDPNKITNKEKKTVTYNLFESLQSKGNFLNYYGNSPLNDYNRNTPNEIDADGRLSSIIEWTHKEKPAMRLDYPHFAYLKDFGVYPPNRLMVLRRYSQPVPDNLFKLNNSIKPLHTMVTYYNLEDNFLNIDFKEEWDSFNGSFMDVLSNVLGIPLSTIGEKVGGWAQGKMGKAGAFLGGVANGNLGQELFYKIGQKLGLISEGGMPYGDPNIIYASKIRKASGEAKEGGGWDSGLTSNIKVTFKTTYVLREFPGIDAKLAMLDILATATHMGTSNARFLITGKAQSELEGIMKSMEKGDINELMGKIIESVTEVIGKLGKSLAKGFVETAENVMDAAAKMDSTAVLDAVLEPLSKIAGSFTKNRYSRYRWQMTGLLGAMSGMYTAPWHVSIGNPKSPWFTCGNMVITHCKIDVGGEMSYNDMFTELNVEYQLEAARPLGAGEITSLFNAGTGRIYDSPDKVQNLYMEETIDFKVTGENNAASKTGAEKTVPPVINTDQKNDLGAGNFSSMSLNNTDNDNNL
jgi:hypothetical protein